MWESFMGFARVLELKQRQNEAASASVTNVHAEVQQVVSVVL